MKRNAKIGIVTVLVILAVIVIATVLGVVLASFGMDVHFTGWR